MNREIQVLIGGVVWLPKATFLLEFLFGNDFKVKRNAAENGVRNSQTPCSQIHPVLMVCLIYFIIIFLCFFFP